MVARSPSPRRRVYPSSGALAGGVRSGRSTYPRSSRGRVGTRYRTREPRSRRRTSVGEQMPRGSESRRGRERRKAGRESECLERRQPLVASDSATLARPATGVGPRAWRGPGTARPDPRRGKPPAHRPRRSRSRRPRRASAGGRGRGRSRSTRRRRSSGRLVRSPTLRSPRPGHRRRPTLAGRPELIEDDPSPAVGEDVEDHVEVVRPV